jgi:hypothetical protein
MKTHTEFEEIAHTGGKITFNVVVNDDGRMSYNVKWSYSGRNPASTLAVYAIPQGVAVADIKLGGIGVPWNPPPIPDCYPVFVSSDSTGMFGRQCPSCNGYWRASSSRKICPYCAFHVLEDYSFLTDAQRRYVKEYCDVLNHAHALGRAGEYVIDMDAVAEAAGKDCQKPDFYYVEERQQNLFTCAACGKDTDVLGTYAYCSSCGTRNDLQELEARIQGLRERINTGGPYEDCVRDTVASFDSFATQYAQQLLDRVPLTPARKNRIEKAHFHNLDTACEIFRNIFDIDILSGMNDKDVAFSKRMFHRRHVYEHRGGEADDKYIEDSGEKVRLKQRLRETQESAHRTASLLVRLAMNLHKGFHTIFPPLKEPIRKHEDRAKKS